MRIWMRSALARALMLGAAAGLAGLLSAPATARAADAGEKALPASTFAYLKFENVAKLRAAFSSSQMGRLLADPAIEPLKKDVLDQLEDADKKVREKLGVSINELLTLPQGPITIALVGKEAADPKKSVALLASADAGENEAKMSEVLAKATKEAEGNNAKVATEKFKDFTFTIVRENEDDKEPLIWTKAGSVFHVASDVEILKDYLSNASGRAESLAANENFQAVQKALNGPQVGLFLDVAQLIKIGVAAAPGGNAAQIQAQLQLTGINGFKAVGAGFDFNQGDYDQVLKLFLYSPGPAQGLLKVFSMPPLVLKPQAWVPASANSYQSFSWDFDAAWKAITDLADANGAGALIEQAQKGIAGPNGDFDFKKDLFGPLGGRVTFVSDYKKPITEKSQRGLAALALDDEKAAQTTFNKMLDLAKATPKKREFQGVTVYEFPVPNLPNAGANGMNMNLTGPISVAIAKGNLFVATEPSLLEQVLRSGGPALADSPEYQAYAKRLPEKSSLVSFSRVEDQARLAYDMVKNGGLQKAIDQANAANPNADAPKPKNPIDPKKIPDFSVFAKYLGQGGSFGVQDEQGLTITSFMLRKENP